MQSALAPPLFPSYCDSLRRVRSCLAALWAAFYMRGEINSNSPAHAGAKPPAPACFLPGQKNELSARLLALRYSQKVVPGTPSRWLAPLTFARSGVQGPPQNLYMDWVCCARTDAFAFQARFLCFGRLLHGCQKRQNSEAIRVRRGGSFCCIAVGIHFATARRIGAAWFASCLHLGNGSGTRKDAGVHFWDKTEE